MKFITQLATALVMMFAVNTFAAKDTAKTTKDKTMKEASIAAPATMSTPDFSLQGHDGKSYKLSEVIKEGNHVVLEWFNNDCPYVKKHYDSGNMQKLQKQFTDKGVKWFTIVSSAKGKQGYMDAKAAAKNKAERQQNATAILLDPTGEVGQTYGAKTTPHMFVINPKGDLVYSGAIDSDSSYRPEAIAKSKNYVVAALEASMKGKKIAKPTTKPYGCSVKYN